MDNKQLYEKQTNSYNPIFPMVRLEDIIETISDKSIQWILNNYNHIYVEYSESIEITRNKVPSLLRRNGLWITYNTGKETITEYYKGSNNDVLNYTQWTLDDNWERFDKLKYADDSITYQHLSNAVKQLLGSGNTITNYPDDEDLTVDGINLKLKDREYDKDNFSGLGRIILRKNIMTIDGQPKNILSQTMINKENTIYEIRYDFDLNGNEITIPKGCALDFQGGSLRNGTLYGEVLNDFVRPEWFGAIGNGKSDDSIAIQTCINVLPDKGIISLSKEYKIKNIILSNKNITFMNGTLLPFVQEGCSCVHDRMMYSDKFIDIVFQNVRIGETIVGDINKGEGEQLSNIYILNAKNVVVDNCKITGVVQSSVAKPVPANSKFLDFYSVFFLKDFKKAIARNCELTDNPGKEVFYFSSRDKNGIVEVLGNYCHDNWRSYTSFYIVDGTPIIKNNHISECETSGIGVIADNAIIDGNKFYNFHYSAINLHEWSYRSNNVIITNNLIDNSNIHKFEGFKDSMYMGWGIWVIGSNLNISNNIIKNTLIGINADDLVSDGLLNNPETWMPYYGKIENISIADNQIDFARDGILIGCIESEKVNLDDDIKLYNLNIIGNTFTISDKTKDIELQPAKGDAWYGQCVHVYNAIDVNIYNNNFKDWGHQSTNYPTPNIGAVHGEGYLRNVLISNNKYSYKQDKCLFSFNSQEHLYTGISQISLLNNVTTVTSNNDSNLINIAGVNYLDQLVIRTDIILGEDSVIITNVEEEKIEPAITIVNGVIYTSSYPISAKKGGIMAYSDRDKKMLLWVGNEWASIEGKTLILNNLFGDESNKPANLQTFDAGLVYFNRIDVGLIGAHIWDGYSWRYPDGVPVVKKHGPTSDRPSLDGNSYNIGFMYFDTDLRKPIFWTGTKWVDAIGADV